MTFSLAISNGDLSLGGSRLDLVYGKNKLLQDLGTWFREQYQVDRFNPGYGSTLPKHIGGIADEMTIFLIRAEAVRILNNYHQHQIADFARFPENYSADELIREIVSVTTETIDDSVIIRAEIRTVGDELVTLEERA